MNLHTDEIIYETGLCNKCIYIVSHTIVNMSTNVYHCSIFWPENETPNPKRLGGGGDLCKKQLNFQPDLVVFLVVFYTFLPSN